MTPPVNAVHRTPDIDMTEPLDAQALAKLNELDPTGSGGLVQRVLTVYRGSLAKLRQQLAVSASDPAGLRIGAHALKSSSASVGALALSQLCAEVEHAVRDQRLHELPQLAARLLGEIDRVDDAVARLLEH